MPMYTGTNYDCTALYVKISKSPNRYDAASAPYHFTALYNYSLTLSYHLGSLGVCLLAFGWGQTAHTPAPTSSTARSPRHYMLLKEYGLVQLICRLPSPMGGLQAAAAAQPLDHGQCGSFLDVILRQGASILQLLACKDETLFFRG